MRDRSILPPEKALFPDEESLLERYEAVVAERDELEVKVQTLTSIIVQMASGQIDWFSVMSWIAKGGRTSESPQKRAARTRSANRATSQPVVYYLRRGDQVKIGTSRSLRARLQALHAQPTDLLAVELGDQTLELGRHKQFGSCRLPRTELFDRSPELMEHISSVVAAFGDPKQFI